MGTGKNLVAVQASRAMRRDNLPACSLKHVKPTAGHVLGVLSENGKRAVLCGIHAREHGFVSYDRLMDYPRYQRTDVAKQWLASVNGESKQVILSKILRVMFATAGRRNPCTCVSIEEMRNRVLKDGIHADSEEFITWAIHHHEDVEKWAQDRKDGTSEQKQERT